MGFHGVIWHSLIVTHFFANMSWFRTHKIYRFTFSTLPPHRNNTGRWQHSPKNIRNNVSYIGNTIAADDLATRGAKCWWYFSDCGDALESRCITVHCDTMLHAAQLIRIWNVRLGTHNRHPYLLWVSFASYLEKSDRDISRSHSTIRACLLNYLKSFVDLPHIMLCTIPRRFVSFSFSFFIFWFSKKIVCLTFIGYRFIIWIYIHTCK